MKFNPPAAFRDQVYLVSFGVFAALYLKGVITDQDLANWNDALPALLALLAKLNVSER